MFQLTRSRNHLVENSSIISGLSERKRARMYHLLRWAWLMPSSIARSRLIALARWIGMTLQSHGIYLTRMTKMFATLCVVFTRNTTIARRDAEKNGFVEVSKTLARYVSGNNFVW